MFRLDVAEALRNGRHDVVRASETGLARADDQQIFINHGPIPFLTHLPQLFLKICKIDD